MGLINPNPPPTIHPVPYTWTGFLGENNSYFKKLKNNFMNNRNLAVKFSVTKITNGETWYMCRTNWSKTNSAGVMEFTNTNDAISEASNRNVIDPVLIGWNSIGERIL